MTTKSTTSTAKTANTSVGNGIYKKILAVQKQVDAVPKRGFNAFHKYHYATEADILTVKETLNNVGLIILPTTLSEETGFSANGKSWARVTLLFRVVDVDTGEELESRFTGYAEDNNDKAIYKATTGANKYFYLKFFGIATEDDPEREDLSAGKPYGTPQKAPARSFRSEQANVTQADDNAIGATLPANKNQALVMANKILALQKQHNLSNEEILAIGEIDSIKDLVENGNTLQLVSTYTKLSDHVRAANAPV